MLQLLDPYTTTRRTTDFIRQIFAGKVVSLLFNMLSWFVTVFLSRINVF